MTDSDRRIHTPVIVHQTGATILHQHAEQLRHTLEVHHEGMTPTAICAMEAEIAKIEKLMEVVK